MAPPLVRNPSTSIVGGGGHAPDHAGDERAVPGVRVDVVGVDGLDVALDARAEPRAVRVRGGAWVPTRVDDRDPDALPCAGILAQRG